MRQLLLRVPDVLHERLAARAAQTGQSVNALANQALATAVGGAPDDERTQMRMRAAAIGVLVDTAVVSLTGEDRSAILESMRGVGPVLDELLDDERGPR